MRRRANIAYKIDFNYLFMKYMKLCPNNSVTRAKINSFTVLRAVLSECGGIYSTVKDCIYVVKS